jgi:hypothetical protein
MRERQRMVETQILPDYDIESYAEFTLLKKDNPEFHLQISAEKSRAEGNWSLLFAGFDSSKRPHLFTISERAKKLLQYSAICSLR